MCNGRLTYSAANDRFPPNPVIRRQSGERPVSILFGHSAKLRRTAYSDGNSLNSMGVHICLKGIHSAIAAVSRCYRYDAAAARAIWPLPVQVIGIRGETHYVLFRF